jgi:hypothetical protein
MLSCISPSGTGSQVDFPWEVRLRSSAAPCTPVARRQPAAAAPSWRCRAAGAGPVGGGAGGAGRVAPAWARLLSSWPSPRGAAHRACSCGRPAVVRHPPAEAAAWSPACRAGPGRRRGGRGLGLVPRGAPLRGRGRAAAGRQARPARARGGGAGAGSHRPGRGCTPWASRVAGPGGETLWRGGGGRSLGGSAAP